MLSKRKTYQKNSPKLNALQPLDNLGYSRPNYTCSQETFHRGILLVILKTVNFFFFFGNPEMVPTCTQSRISLLTDDSCCTKTSALLLPYCCTILPAHGKHCPPHAVSDSVNPCLSCSLPVFVTDSPLYDRDQRLPSSLVI